MFRFSLTAAGSILFLAAACQPAAPPAVPGVVVDTAAVERELADLWERYSAANLEGDATTVAGFYAEDARLDVRGFPPVLGRAALDTVLRQVYAEMNYTAAEVTPSWTLVKAPDLAYQGGAYSETYVQGRRTMTEYGRFATALVKEADGQWRIAYLAGFTDSTVTRR